MENTTHETQKKTGFLARIRQELKERKRRILRLIELKRLQRIRKKTVPGYTYCKNCGTKLEGMYCHCSDNMPSTSTSRSGNISSNTLKMSTSSTAKSGKLCGSCSPARVS